MRIINFLNWAAYLASREYDFCGTVKGFLHIVYCDWRWFTYAQQCIRHKCLYEVNADYRVQGRIQGVTGVTSHPLPGRKRYIIGWRISHLRLLLANNLRGFDRCLTLATNNRCKPSQKEPLIYWVGLTPFVLYGFLYALISSSVDRFSNLFHCLNQENICNNTVATDPTTPQLCRYTTLWNVNVLKATTENKTTSVTTRFKKLTTGNNVFIVSVII